MSATIRDGLVRLTERLRETSKADAPREARVLLAHVLATEPGRLVLAERDGLPDDRLEAALALVERRAMGEPVSHLLGYREFMGRRFSVSAHVLDPRPETEVLVLQALARPFMTVLDLGTGSGAILLSLLAETQGTRGAGTDISQNALDTACANAEALTLGSRAEFLRSDWFENVTGQFDLIVSNPPYIAAAEMMSLQRELSFEPRLALTDEADGLTAYRAIAAKVYDYLAPGGRLLLEIGHSQGADVRRILADAGLSGIKQHLDLDGCDRVVEASRSL